MSKVRFKHTRTVRSNRHQKNSNFDNDIVVKKITRSGLKPIKSSTKTTHTKMSEKKVNRKEFSHLSNTLHDVVDHLEEELEHVRKLNRDLRMEMNDTGRLSVTESINVARVRRPSQIKSAYKDALTKMEKMKRSQHKNHKIIRKLSADIRQQLITISEAPSEKEIIQLLNEIRYLLKDLGLRSFIEEHTNEGDEFANLEQIIKETERTQTGKRMFAPKRKYGYEYEHEYSADRRRSPRRHGNEDITEVTKTTKRSQRSPKHKVTNYEYESRQVRPDSEDISTDVEHTHKVTKTTRKRSPKRKGPKRIREEYEYEYKCEDDTRDSDIHDRKYKYKKTSKTVRNNGGDQSDSSEDSEIKNLRRVLEETASTKSSNVRSYKREEFKKYSSKKYDSTDERSAFRDSFLTTNETVTTVLDSLLEKEKMISKSVYEEQKQKWKQRNGDLQTRLQALQDRFDNQKIKYESESVVLRESVNAIEDKFNDSQSDLEKLRIKNRKLSEKYAHLCAEFDTAKVEFYESNDVLLKRNQSLKVKYEQSIERQIIEIKEKNELLTKVQSLEKERAEMRRHCMEYTEMYQSESELHNIREIAEESQSKNIRNISENNELIRQIQKMIAEMNEMNQTQEMCQIQSELKALIEDIPTQKSGNSDEKELRSQISTLEKALKSGSSDESKLRSKISKLESALESGSSDEKELRSKIAELESVLKQKSKAFKKSEKNSKQICKHLCDGIKKIRKDISEIKSKVKKDTIAMNKQIGSEVKQLSEFLTKQTKAKESGESSKKGDVDQQKLNKAFHKWQVDFTTKLKECAVQMDESVDDYDKDMEAIEKADDMISKLVSKQ